MASRKHEFAESDKVRVLLWCGRHCGLCGRAVGVGIEVAHLDRQRCDLDNAIPLCFDCHAAIGHYNCQHPRGRKYSIPELKARRDQIYEQHTRHLVPPVMYEVHEKGWKFPHIGFHISNLGDTYPVRARVQVTLAQGSRLSSFDSGHYSGKSSWNLNPRFGVNGHFDDPKFVSDGQPLRVRIDVTLIDIYDFEHRLLPVGYVHRLGKDDDWYLEPSEEELGIPGPQQDVARVSGAHT